MAISLLTEILVLDNLQAVDRDHGSDGHGGYSRGGTDCDIDNDGRKDE